jgi:predicted Zn-dependent protease
MICTLFRSRAKLTPYILLASLIAGNHALAQSAGTPEALVQNATTLFEAGRYTEALSQAEELKRQAPGRYEGHYFAAAALLRMGLVPRAESAAAEAAKYAGTEKAADQKALEASITRHKRAFEFLKNAEAAGDRGRKLSCSYTIYENFRSFDVPV